MSHWGGSCACLIAAATVALTASSLSAGPQLPTIEPGQRTLSTGRATANGAAPPYQQPSSSPAGWVAVVGDVVQPGCYELPGEGATVAELIARCGGERDGAPRPLRLVRNGRPIGPVVRPNEPLRAGDVLIVESLPSERPAAVHLGLVGLTDRPLAVKVPAAEANVANILAGTNQGHLPLHTVSVVVGGRNEVPGDQAGQLPHGSVIIFNSRLIDERTVAIPPTSFYPASAPPPHDSHQPVARLVDVTPIPTPAPRFTPVESHHAHEELRLTQLAAEPAIEDLSPLPAFEALEGPADDIYYTRTADASASVPIGPPEPGGSHIIPVPAEAIYDLGPSTAAPPATLNPVPQPPAIELPDLNEAATEETSELTLGKIVPTLLIGGFLGAATFFMLRFLRARALIPQTERNAVASSGSAERTEPESLPLYSASPAEMLAALVANRLAFREEQVSLPAAVPVHGRSPAMQRLRIDPAEVSYPTPHIPISTPPAETVAPHAETRGRQMASESEIRFRVDAPQPAPPVSTVGRSGSPFEQALAAMQAARLKNEG